MQQIKFGCCFFTRQICIQCFMKIKDKFIIAIFVLLKKTQKRYILIMYDLLILHFDFNSSRKRFLFWFHHKQYIILFSRVCIA